MRKLGKKTHEMLETVEAYYVCSGCYQICSCSSSNCNCGVAHFGTVTFNVNVSNNEYTKNGASYNVGNGMP